MVRHDDVEVCLCRGDQDIQPQITALIIKPRR